MLDNSFGVIPLRRRNSGDWEVLIILHRGGRHWGFPKGHAEPGETAQQTAEREFHEETGLFVKRLLAEPPLCESYVFYAHGKKIFKTVSYFLAEVSGALLLQKKEVEACKWVLLKEATHHLTYPQARALCHKVLEQLTPS